MQKFLIIEEFYNCENYIHCTIFGAFVHFLIRRGRLPRPTIKCDNLWRYGHNKFHIFTYCTNFGTLLHFFNSAWQVATAFYLKRF